MRQNMQGRMVARSPNNSLLCQRHNNILYHLLAMPEVLSNVEVPVASCIITMTQALGTIHVCPVDAWASNLHTADNAISECFRTS